MNGDYTERISQEGQRKNEAEGGILESASAFAKRVLEEIEALAGTTACRSVQLVRLRQWAQQQGCWFDDMYFIDTIIYPSDTDGYNNYRSLSPRCSRQ